MTRTSRLMMVAAATVAIVAAVPGDAQTRQGRSRHGHGIGVSVAAALNPVGAATGWGRVTVHDLTEGDQIERTVNVELHGLDPTAEYTVLADGVELGTVTTDADGDAWLALRTDHHGMPPVPPDLPPAADLVSALASVVDASMAPTLEGWFVTIAHGEPGMGQLVYQERIRLDPVDDMWLRGIARVARDIDDEEFFDTRAHGLTPGIGYQVKVDDIPAGTVTADAVGQAVLALSTEDGSLPTAMQPVEMRVLVQWFDDGGVVLEGRFSGDGTIGGPPHDDPPGDGPHGPGDGDGNGDGDGDGDGPHGPGDGGDGPNGPGDGDGDCDGDGPHGGGGRP